MDPNLDQLPFDITDPASPDDAPPNDYCVCDDCPGCIEYCRMLPLPFDAAGVYTLLYDLTNEIVLLEEELVRWRQALIKYLPERWADGLRQDIVDNQSKRFFGESDLYDRFVYDYCAGIDPLEADEHVQRMLRLRDGTDSTSIRYL